MFGLSYVDYLTAVSLYVSEPQITLCLVMGINWCQHLVVLSPNRRVPSLAYKYRTSHIGGLKLTFGKGYGQQALRTLAARCYVLSYSPDGEYSANVASHKTGQGPNRRTWQVTKVPLK